jgi:8-oxo-dGTP pyrophosphatase MutT (NUDIX family)
MALIDHIRRCNAYAPEDFIPWSIEGRVAGYVRRELRAVLGAYSGLFIDDGGLALDPRHADAAARTVALAETVERLHRAGIVHQILGERVAIIVDGRRVAAVDRDALSVLGIENAGCHVNGFVRQPDGIHLWIGRRSPAKRAHPNLLDNFVAGLQPDGLSAIETMIKECGEEAGVPPELARRAMPVGIVTYVMATEPGMGGAGLNRHVLHCFDLELPDDFQPMPVDGEVAEFRLLPAVEVQSIIEAGRSFKFNCALVVIDFLIRHGLVGPEHPDYLVLCRGLRASLGKIN